MSNESNESNDTSRLLHYYYTTSFTILPQVISNESNESNENNESYESYENNSPTSSPINNISYFDIINIPINNINVNNMNNVNNIRNILLNQFNEIPDYPNVNDNFTYFPASDLIERLFHDYVTNKNKLTESQYNDSVIKIDKKIDECPICFNSSDNVIKIIKCEHIFCENCIEHWLKDHKNTCPICRINTNNETYSEC